MRLNPCTNPRLRILFFNNSGSSHEADRIYDFENLANWCCSCYTVQLESTAIFAFSSAFNTFNAFTRLSRVFHTFSTAFCAFCAFTSQSFSQPSRTSGGGLRLTVWTIFTMIRWFCCSDFLSWLYDTIFTLNFTSWFTSAFRSTCTPRFVPIQLHEVSVFIKLVAVLRKRSARKSLTKRGCLSCLWCVWCLDFFNLLEILPTDLIPSAACCMLIKRICYS